jgi:hypothetical protein
MRPGVEAQLDGIAAQLVDLSATGAQVVSSLPLRPNQRVRFGLTSDVPIRMAATVVWANFELPKGRPTPQYRAGLEFTSPNAESLERFCVAFGCADNGPTGPSAH